ncbi:MAG: restriction endonuclease subunit S [Burkholderiales bacterium]|jgi:type I restriction enzyme S subunit|nr:restriction endonuclease subunit S [Betaproteobacteria bacterium]
MSVVQRHMGRKPVPHRVALLGDVCKTTSGGTPSRSNSSYFEGDIPWVKSGELPDGPVAEIQESISEEALNNSSAKLFPAGTLLIALYGATVGKLGVLTKAAATNQAVCAVFPSAALEQKYLFWFLRFKRRALIESAIGGAQPNISQGILRNLEVPLPEIAEQQEVVAEIEKQFSRLDEAIANLKRVKANLKRYKAAVLKAAVEGRLVPTEAELARKDGHDYETGEQLLQRILETRRREWKGKGKYKEPSSNAEATVTATPEGWTIATIEQLSSIVEYGTSAKTTENDVGVPVLRMGNIFEGSFDFSKLKYLPSTHAEFPKLLLNHGDLLFNRTNSPELVGKSAVFNEQIRSYSFASYLIRARFVEPVAPDFVAAYINSSFGRAWVKSVVTQQVGQANVNGSKLQALTVPLPPALEQQRIAAEIDRRLSLISSLEAQVASNLRRAERLRSSVLASAFAGSNN